MWEHILLIEDDSRLRVLVSEYLSKAGFHILQADTGCKGLSIHARNPVDSVILDLTLPDMDGLEICRQIRMNFDTPILMLTARGDAMDRVLGLEMGADDYLTKPFEPRELLARLRGILRRRRGGTRGEILRFGQLEIDRGCREVRLEGVPRPLTSYQFALLLALAEHAGRVLSRDALIDLTKGEPLETSDSSLAVHGSRIVDVHVSRIRASIETEPKRPRRIITVRGAGYLFAKAQE